MTDALLSLAVAVILVRSFAVEGYMISTGSMAPTLPGFHKRVTCPDCRYEFAVGVADDDEQSRFAEHYDDGPQDAASSESTTAVCPNCGRNGIDLSSVSRNQGDQLLVYKNAYLFRSPKRWEVVVFRNPARPIQAYVKRVVGLPGEQIEIRDGDIWFNGVRARKNLKQQRAARISVFDLSFTPVAKHDWKPRWVADAGEFGWKRIGNGFEIAHEPGSNAASVKSVTYRHWIRDGGLHHTTIAIPDKIANLDYSFPSLFPLRYDSENRELSHKGVLSDDNRDLIRQSFRSPDFAKLIDRLAEESHLSPILDEYGYNRRRDHRQPAVVRDLMVAFTLTLKQGTGRFITELTDGHRRFRVILDLGTREISVAVVGGNSPIARARLKADALLKPMLFEMSLFDRQVLVAVNGHQVFEPVHLEAVPKGTPAPRRPVRFGASNLSTRVENLKLYRDIYYTQKGSTNRFTVDENEFFVLGDNSPISADSRVWPHSGVHRSLLLGKPFLVHLPSRPGRLNLGQFEMRVRIPDFSRIRYIR